MSLCDYILEEFDFNKSKKHYRRTVLLFDLTVHCSQERISMYLFHFNSNSTLATYLILHWKRNEFELTLYAILLDKWCSLSPTQDSMYYVLCRKSWWMHFSNFPFLWKIFSILTATLYLFIFYSYLDLSVVFWLLCWLFTKEHSLHCSITSMVVGSSKGCRGTAIDCVQKCRSKRMKCRLSFPSPNTKSWWIWPSSLAVRSRGRLKSSLSARAGMLLTWPYTAHAPLSINRC